MGLLSIADIIRIVRKYILLIVALSVAAGILGGVATSMIQTYTCTLGFKFNHAEAAEGLAPDGESKLDPYEIQNPVIIQAALKNMGVDGEEFDVKGIRQSISISKVITDLDKEVSESAALLGEKYDIAATEYEMKFTYDAGLGDEFGAKMFNNIIKEYDKFLFTKYYNKKSVVDFAKVINGSNADYIVIAETMNESIEDAITTLDLLAGDYPDFRSVTTGYSFVELSRLYQNLRDIQYAKYYGNVRAGNLAKDREMVIKGYQAKVKELQESYDVSLEISENYKAEIKKFYDSYKAAGLYHQAQQMQSNLDSTNNRDQDVLHDSELEDYRNTYDDIVLSYAERASDATDAMHSINYYNQIINSFANDNVSKANKDRLLAKNEIILEEITALSAQYSKIANDTIGELYDSKINSDLQYLILPEVSSDKPVKLIAVFLAILTFGFALIAVIGVELVKSFLDSTGLSKELESQTEKKVFIDTANMDELHQLLYNQYISDFNEFFLVYQPMVPSNARDALHSEVFIRWQSPELGMISPGRVIECIDDLGIHKHFNDWLISKVCKDLAEMSKSGMTLPVVHINCPYSHVNNFALNDIIIKHIIENDIPASNLCFELAGKDIAGSLEDILLLEEMGINICIDKFENSNEDQEIISVIKPKYIKMSLDILNMDMYATSDEDIEEASAQMKNYFTEILAKCRKNSIKTCICGIEKKSQDALAAEVGFDYKQGYFYGKPERIKK